MSRRVHYPPTVSNGCGMRGCRIKVKGPPPDRYVSRQSYDDEDTEIYELESLDRISDTSSAANIPDNVTQFGLRAGPTASDEREYEEEDEEEEVMNLSRESSMGNVLEEYAYRSNADDNVGSIFYDESLENDVEYFLNTGRVKTSLFVSLPSQYDESIRQSSFADSELDEPETPPNDRGGCCGFRAKNDNDTFQDDISHDAKQFACRSKRRASRIDRTPQLEVMSENEPDDDSDFNLSPKTIPEYTVSDIPRKRSISRSSKAESRDSKDLGRGRLPSTQSKLSTAYEPLPSRQTGKSANRRSSRNITSKKCQSLPNTSRPSSYLNQLKRAETERIRRISRMHSYSDAKRSDDFKRYRKKDMGDRRKDELKRSRASRAIDKDLRRKYGGLHGGIETPDSRLLRSKYNTH